MATLGKRKRETGRWSDLPEDILLKIMKLLRKSDRVGLRAVCNGWRLPPNRMVDEGSRKLPWTMEFRWRKTSDPYRTRSKCMVCEPFHKGGKISHLIEYGRIEGRRDFVDARVQASRDGWVLFSKEKTRTNLFFFFHAFTGEVIWLPELASRSSGLVATFSTPPTSDDCVVFVAHPPKSGRLSAISTYSISTDKAWKTRSFEKIDRCLESVEAVAYMEGTFYCHFGWSIVVAFKFGREENWSFVKASSPDLSIIYKDPNHLLECEGELLLVYEKCRDGGFPIFRLDRSNNEWVPMRDLKGGTIFLGKTSFWISISSVRGSEILANRICFHSSWRADFGPCHNPDRETDDWAERKLNRKTSEVYGYCEAGLETIWIHPPRQF